MDNSRLIHEAMGYEVESVGGQLVYHNEALDLERGGHWTSPVPNYFTREHWQDALDLARDDARHDKPVEVTCWECNGYKMVGDGTYGLDYCHTCHGTGRVTIGAWTWEEFILNQDSSKHVGSARILTTGKIIFKLNVDYIGPAFIPVFVEFLKSRKEEG